MCPRSLRLRRARSEHASRLGGWIQSYLEKAIHTPMAQGPFTEIISMINWIRTSRLSMKNSLLEARRTGVPRSPLPPLRTIYKLPELMYKSIKKGLLIRARVVKWLSQVLAMRTERVLHRKLTGPNPLNHRDDLSRPALRHGSVNSLFQVALYLPSWRRPTLTSSA